MRVSSVEEIGHCPRFGYSFPLHQVALVSCRWRDGLKVRNIQTLFFLLVLMFAWNSQLSAQSNTHQVRLLDAESAQPIVGATFEYGVQQGISGTDGSIRFRLSEDQTMVLSHVNYGIWTLDHQQLQRAITQQVLYRHVLTYQLFPVAVVAMRRQEGPPDEFISMSYTERMAHDAASVLNQLASFNSIRKGGNYGFDPVFRGFKYDQLNVVLNGAQSATAACPNRMDPPSSQMAPNMMERVEVLKGPHALRYGTGFGATINFIPAKLRFAEQPDLYGRVSTGYETNGQLIRGETQLGLSGKRYDFSLFGSWSQGQDYRTGSGDTVQADFSRGSFGADLGLALGEKQTLRLSGLYNRARDADFPALPMDLRLDDTWMVNARHEVQIGGERLQSWNTTVFGSFVDHLMNNLLKPLNPRTVNTETAANTYNYGGRAEGLWHLGRGVLYSGADLRIEGARGIRTREFLMGPQAGNTLEDNAWQSSRISKTGLFGEYQLPTTALNLVFSARLEWNQAEITDPSSEFLLVYDETGINQINPSFSLGMQRYLGESISTALWLGRAQRSGSLTERFINYFPVGQDPYEMLGNPQLAPEVNNQADLTFAWQKGQTAVQVDAFAAYLQDAISSVIDTSLSPRIPMSPGVRQFINIDQAFKTGVELRWVQQLVWGLHHTLSAAYTYGQDLERSEPLPEIAPLDLRYALSGSYVRDKLLPEVSFRYVMQQERISSEFGETVTPAFALLDLKIAYVISDALSAKIGVNNLLNTNYYEHLNRSVQGTANPIFAPGRNGFVSLSGVF